MPPDSDVSAGNAELAVLKKLRKPDQAKIHNPAERELEELDSIRVVRNNNPGRPIQVKHDMDSESGGFPFWGKTYRGESPLIPHLEDENSDSVVKYDECHHDVAAIHWDTTPSALDQEQTEEAILYLRGKIREHLKWVTNPVLANEEDHEFELILFSDLDDLEQQIRDLSAGGLLGHPDLEMETVAADLNLLETPQSKVGAVNLRSLSILLPKGKLDCKNGNSYSAYFLNVMKPDSETVDFCNYSSCVFSVSENHQKILGNFFNYLQAFLCSTLTHETKSTSAEDGIRTSTRTRPISINSASEHSDLVRSAFSTHGKGHDREINQYVNIYNSNSGPLGETFCRKPGDDDPSELFNWLNQYNLRVFNQKMDTSADPWIQFNFRSLTKQVEGEIINFCNNLKSQSIKWEDHMSNCQDQNFNGTNFSTIGQVKNLFNKLTQTSYEGICHELDLNRNQLVRIQFNFYRDIISNFHTIRERVQKIQHEGEMGKRSNIEMSFLYNRYNIKLDLILLLSILHPIKQMCHKITDFTDSTRYPGISNWTGFEKWRIYKQGGTQ